MSLFFGLATYWGPVPTATHLTLQGLDRKPGVGPCKNNNNNNNNNQVIVDFGRGSHVESESE